VLLGALRAIERDLAARGGDWRLRVEEEEEEPISLSGLKLRPSELLNL
jgi:hypothetical protein